MPDDAEITFGISLPKNSNCRVNWYLNFNSITKLKKMPNTMFLDIL